VQSHRPVWGKFSLPPNIKIVTEDSFFNEVLFNTKGFLPGIFF
jgi:hypothetical protein